MLQWTQSIRVGIYVYYTLSNIKQKDKFLKQSYTLI